MKTLTSILIGMAVLIATDAKAANFNGKWITTASMPEGDSRDSALTIAKKDGKLQATMISQDGSERIMDKAKADGKTLTIEFDYDRDGQSGVIGAKASLDKDGVLVGNWYVKGDDGTEVMTNKWKAVRNASAVLGGKWDVLAVTPDNDIEHVMVVKKAGSKFTGYAESDEGQLEYTKLTAEKNVVKMELPYGGGTVKVEAKLNQARKLVGKWTYFDEFKDEVGNGEWSATKQKRVKKNP